MILYRKNENALCEYNSENIQNNENIIIVNIIVKNRENSEWFCKLVL